MCNKCNGNCNSCDCTCNKPCNTPDCSCEVFITTDCVTMTEDLVCSNILKGQTETEVLKQLDAYICERFTSVEKFLQIVNVGTGAGVYKGISVLGKKELKSLISDGTVNITSNADTISFSIDVPELQGLQSVLNVDPYAEFESGNTFVDLASGDPDERSTWIQNGDGNEFTHTSLFNNSATLEGANTILDKRGNFQVFETKPHIAYILDETSSVKNSTVSFAEPLTNTFIFFPAKSITGNYTLATLDDIPIVNGSETKINAGTNISVSGNGTIATPYVINNSLVVDGSETKINAGTNTSVSGNGTIATPYVISNTQVVDGSETKINNGTNTTVVGLGTTASPYQINVPIPDGTETKLISGTTTVVSGNGTIATPYKVETINLQKPITGDYLLTSADNNYSIKINNGATPITITVPTGLPENFFVGFTQKGTADVTFVGSGTTIFNPIGLKIKGEGFCVGLEQIGTSNTFDLIADTKA